MSDGRRAVHALRGALNGVVLQLEVVALAHDRGDDTLLKKALAAARRAAAEATALVGQVDQVDQVDPVDRADPVDVEPGS